MYQRKVVFVFLIIPLMILIGCNDNNMFWKKKKAQQINPLDTRWICTADLTEDEKLVHAQVDQLIDNWWQEFFRNQQKIDEAFTKGSTFDIVKFMNTNLNCIHENISWEFGSAIHGNGHRLILTSESNKPLRPLVNEILKRAPRLKGWEFYGYRLAESYNDAIATVKSRTGGQIVDFKVQLEINELNQINIYLTHETCKTKQDYNQAFNDAFVAIETILGEENLDKWVGAIEVDQKVKDSLDVKPINELNDLFTKKLHEINYYQPQEPVYKTSTTASWSMLELKPQEQKDYPRQSDIFIAKTMNFPLWQTAHSSQLFYSERFSKFGETFCYIKIDGSEGLEESKFEDKAALEDALDSLLIKEQVGCLIGGGTGLKYSYIDLALTDLNKGVELVKEVLKEGNITKKSWILFYDSELEYEWIGIWEDTPKPLL